MRPESVVLELAGLLRAGVATNLARQTIEPKISGFTNQQRRQFEAIWGLATRNGGSVSLGVQALGDLFQSNASQLRLIEVAFAGPRAAARLISFLPIIGLLVGQLFGLNPIGVIFENRLALIAVLVAMMMLIGGQVWTKSILKWAQPSDEDPALLFDAVLVGVSAGAPLAVAIAESKSEFEKHCLPAAKPEVDQRFAEIAELNRVSGASVSELLKAAARALRERTRFEEAAAVERISVQLMLPLGLITLPAFVLSSIVPIAISLLSNGQM